MHQHGLHKTIELRLFAGELHKRFVGDNGFVGAADFEYDHARVLFDEAVAFLAGLQSPFLFQYARIFNAKHLPVIEKRREHQRETQRQRTGKKSPQAAGIRFGRYVHRGGVRNAPNNLHGICI